MRIPRSKTGDIRRNERLPYPAGRGASSPATGYARRLWTALVTIALAVSGASVAADELPASGDTRVDDLHELVAEQVSLTADWLDSFFDDDNFRDEVNQSSLRLTLGSFSERGEGTELTAKARLRVRLPQLHDNLLLFVNGNDDDLDTTDSDWEDTDDAFTGNDLRGVLKERLDADIARIKRTRSHPPKRPPARHGLSLHDTCCQCLAQ